MKKLNSRLIALLLLGLLPEVQAQTIVPPREATAAQVTAGTMSNVFISPRRLAGTGQDIVLGGDLTISGDDIFGVNGLNVTASAASNKNLTLSSSGTGNVLIKRGSTTLATFNGSTDVVTLAAAAVTGATTFNGAIQAASATTTYAATTDLPFTSPLQTVTLTGNVTFTTSARAAGAFSTIRVICDGTDRTLTFPAWVWAGMVAPASITASKTALLSLVCFGTAETDVIATWVSSL